jgi:hypothetical protein
MDLLAEEFGRTNDQLSLSFDSLIKRIVSIKNE